MQLKRVRCWRPWTSKMKLQSSSLKTKLGALWCWCSTHLYPLAWPVFINASWIAAAQKPCFDAIWQSGRDIHVTPSVLWCINFKVLLLFPCRGVGGSGWAWLGWHFGGPFNIFQLSDFLCQWTPRWKHQTNLLWCTAGGPNNEFNASAQHFCKTLVTRTHATNINKLQYMFDALVGSGFSVPAIPAIPSFSRGWLDLKRTLAETLQLSVDSLPSSQDSEDGDELLSEAETFAKRPDTCTLSAQVAWCPQKDAYQSTVEVEGTFQDFSGTGCFLSGVSQHCSGLSRGQQVPWQT